jgi:hypothetical protein
LHEDHPPQNLQHVQALFSDEEKRAQQRAVQSKRREWKKTQADIVVAMPKRAAVQ